MISVVTPGMVMPVIWTSITPIMPSYIIIKPLTLPTSAIIRSSADACVPGRKMFMSGECVTARMGANHWPGVTLVILTWYIDCADAVIGAPMTTTATTSASTARLRFISRILLRRCGRPRTNARATVDAATRAFATTPTRTCGHWPQHPQEWRFYHKST